MGATSLGLLNDKVKVQGDAENPLTLLVKQLQGTSIKPVANPLPDNDDLAA